MPRYRSTVRARSPAPIFKIQSALAAWIFFEVMGREKEPHLGIPEDFWNNLIVGFMETKTFRTNLNCGSCINSVTPFLDSDPEIKKWKVDIDDERKPLTVSGHHVDPIKVRELVSKAGFEVFEVIRTDPKLETEKSPEYSMDLKIYYPLILILFYLVGGILVLALRTNDFSIPSLMEHFMAGFFIIFSFFKLLDLKGFAESYQSYDVVAIRFPIYGYIYPFIELTLGVSYLTSFKPVYVNVVTMVVMFVSSIGVIQSVTKKQKIRCACLGTMFNLPMSTVTLFEDLSMFVMAIVMIMNA